MSWSRCGFLPSHPSATVSESLPASSSCLAAPQSSPARLVAPVAARLLPNLCWELKDKRQQAER